MACGQLTFLLPFCARMLERDDGGKGLESRNTYTMRLFSMSNQNLQFFRGDKALEARIIRVVGRHNDGSSALPTDVLRPRKQLLQ